VLLVTGSGTGKASPLEDVRAVKAAVPEAPVLVASGVTDNTLMETLRVANGVIIGTWLKRNGMVHEPVDIERVRTIVASVKNESRAEN
jgi:predicted TIM-barrel enzyme